MSSKRRQQLFKCAAIGVLLYGGATSVLPGAELPPTKPVEHTNPFESDEASENLTGSKPGVTPDSLKDRGLAPHGSLRGVPAPVPLPGRPTVAPNNTRLQDMMDRKKDWVFREPESLLEGPQRPDAFGNEPKKTDEERLSPMERYYLKFSSPSARRETSPGSDREKKESEKSNEDLLPQGLRSSEAFLLEVTQQARQSSLSGARLESAEGFSGVGSLLAPQLTPAQKFRQDAFRQLVQDSYMTPGAMGVPGLDAGLQTASTLDGARKPETFFTPSGSLSGSTLIRPPEAQLGVVPAMPSLMEMNARAMMPQTPMLQSPAMQQQPLPFKPPTVSSGPPRPTFTAPRRPF